MTPSHDVVLVGGGGAGLRAAIAIAETNPKLGIAGDLHLVRLERVRELAEALKKHAKHENEGLYRWAASRGERV